VCPKLEVCHEHHSPPPIAPAQKRSDQLLAKLLKLLAEPDATASDQLLAATTH